MSMQIIVNPSQMTVADRERLNQVLDLFAAVRPNVAPAVPIAPDDNPAAGVEQPSANRAFTENPNGAFAGAAPTANQAFADPNANPPGVIASTSTESGPASVSIPGAPLAAAMQAGTPANVGVEVDKNGLPWDAQIHAETKTKNKDLTWRYKRGVDKAVIAAREEQLRALMSVPGAAPLGVVAGSQVASTPAVQSAPAPAPVVHDAGNVPPPPPASTAPSQVAPLSVPAAATPTNAAFANPSPSNFVEFIGKVAPLMQAGGRLTQDEVKAACLAHGVPDLALVSARPDLIPAINASIDAILATKP